jgi:hypothetical protein
MQDQVANKIVEMLGQLQAGVGSAVTQLKQISPDMVNLGLSAVSVDAISSLIYSAICGLFCLGVLFACVYWFIKINKAFCEFEAQEEQYFKVKKVWGNLSWEERKDIPEPVEPRRPFDAPSDDMRGALFIAGVSALILFLVAGLFGFFDLWNWVAIFNPKLYVAHQIIAKIGG